MVSAWRTLSPSSCSTRAPPSPRMLSPASLLNQAVREAHPEVVLAMLGRGVDQPSARRARHVQPGRVFSRTIKLMLERQKSSIYQHVMLFECAKITPYQQDMSH